MARRRARSPDKPLDEGRERFPRTWNVRRHVVATVLLLFACTAVYYPALQGDYLWDDDAHVTPPELTNWAGLLRIWTEPGVTQQYYPLLYSAFWLEHRLWGDSKLAYHLTNVVQHVAAASLLALLLLHLGLARPWFTAALFALHPVCVESVAWITEQKNTLSAVFYLAAALVFLRFAEQRGWCRYWLATLLFLAALLAKTVSVTLPAALLVILWWRRRRLSWRSDVAPLVPWFVLSVMASLITVWVEKDLVGAGSPEEVLTPLHRLLVAGRAIWFYAGKLIWPTNLVFIYPRWTIDPSEAWQWVAPITAIAVLLGLWIRRRSAPGALAGALLFVGTLSPTFGLFDVYAFRYSFVADHFQYLPAMAGVALIVASLDKLASGLSKALRIALATALVLASAGLSAHYSRNYSNAETHYREILERNPGAWMAYNNLAMLVAGSDPRQAMELLKSGLALRDNSFEIQFNLGNLLVASGRLREAEACFTRALSLNPDLVAAENNLGNLLRRMGRNAEALDHLERAVARSPGFAPARTNLGAVLTNLGRAQEAIPHLREAILLDPSQSTAHLNLGLALAKTGAWQEAITEYQAAIRLDPNDAAAENNFGDALLQSGRVDEATLHFERSLALDPNNAAAENNLGVALSLAGRLVEARAHFEAALRIRPDYTNAQQNLERNLRQTALLARGK